MTDKKELAVTEQDTCSKCGAKYDDILGIGCCGDCFYGHETINNQTPTK